MYPRVIFILLIMAFNNNFIFVASNRSLIVPDGLAKFNGRNFD